MEALRKCRSGPHQTDRQVQQSAIAFECSAVVTCNVKELQGMNIARPRQQDFHFESFKPLHQAYGKDIRGAPFALQSRWSRDLKLNDFRGTLHPSRRRFLKASPRNCTLLLKACIRMLNTAAKKAEPLAFGSSPSSTTVLPDWILTTNFQLGRQTLYHCATRGSSYQCG